MVITQFANHKPVEKGSGDTIRVNRLLRPAKQTSEATSGTLITPSSAKALATNFQDYDLENWGDSFGFNEDVEIASWVSDADNRDVIATQMAQSLEFQVYKKLANQGMRFRIDKDSDYQKSGTVTTGSTTAIISTGLDEATDDFWNGGSATITNPSGPNYDIAARITDFDEGTDAAICAPPQAYTTSSKFHITVGTGIIATDKLTTTGLLDVAARHELMETEKFPGGMYRMVMHSAQKRDLNDDSTFLNSAINDNSARFEKYQLGRWFDIEFLVGSEIFREDEDGTENQATGVVYFAPVFGKNSYSIYSFANPGGSGKFSTKFYVVDTPDSQNLRNSAKYLSWKGFWAGGVNRATSMIQLMTGATDLGITV
jgi:hypothetical protein